MTFVVDEKLPDLEDQVERSRARYTIAEKHKPKNPIEMKYSQKMQDDMVRVGSPDFEFFIKQLEDIAE